MKNRSILIVLVAILSLPAFGKMVQDSSTIADGIARVNSERISNTLHWIKDSAVSDQQMLINLVTYKLEKLSDRLDALKDQLQKKLTPEQQKELLALKDKITKQVEAIKDMSPEEKKLWREKLKFKLDVLPQEIMLFSKKIEESVSGAAEEQFQALQDKAAKFGEWFKKLPVSDKEAIQQVLKEKVESLPKRISVLKQLGRAVEYEEIKAKIDDFVTRAKEQFDSIKEKALELYEKAGQALKTSKK